MDRTRKDPTGGNPSGLGPRADRPAEVPFGVPPVGSMPVDDPELRDDLGAEYEFRGDVLEDELEAARREAAAHLDTAQRLQADFDNYRKRVARDAEDAAKRAGQRVISEMLPALDNLERALAHVESGGEGQQLTDGVRMVVQQVLDVFAKEGVERIDPLGQQFDPNEHQAVGQSARDDVPESTVVDMFQAGYRMHGRVLRPAAVVVSTGGPAPKE
ncbi:MAG: nucleotide exchange factor GrpE [Coriobacteriia bacterium]|nr:nucleotide exchange factor GrpE [Coriobacteriia bacterium]